jgi:glycosyltransferase involved in cell wall biosynthesis
MRILVVDKLVPYPPVDGGRIRVFNLLQHISRHHEVTLVTMYKPSTGEDSGAAILNRFCTKVELVARQELSVREYRFRQLRGILNREPMRSMIVWSEKMAEKIATLTENQHFDIVDIQRPCLAPYVKTISPKSRCRKILTLYDVPYVQYRRIMMAERDWRAKLRIFYMDWLFSKRATLEYGSLFDKYVLVSELDRVTLMRERPNLDIAVVPNGVDTKGYPFLTEQPTKLTLLLVGKMNYLPNVDAAIFFCQEVFSLIKQRVPDAKLLIVGGNPRSSVQALASDDVTVTGYVDSVIPYYQQSHVSVVPIRSGGGTRLKILESMALGRPVVSTTVGCEGLAVTHEENILIADDPSDFAAQTVRLLNDAELRARLIRNGRRLVETTYDWEVIAQRLLRTYDEAIGNGKISAEMRDKQVP